MSKGGISKMNSVHLLLGVYAPPLIMAIVFGAIWGAIRLMNRHGRDKAEQEQASHGRLDGILTWSTTIVSGVSVVFSIILIHTFSGPIKGSIIPSDFPLVGNIYQLTNYDVDGLSLFFTSVVNIVTLFASAFTFHVNEREGNPSNEMYKFHFWFNIFHFVMLLVPFFSNLLLLWCFIALTTATSVPLISFPKSQESKKDSTKNRRPREAALKYVLISAFSLTFALLGTLLFGIVLHSISTLSSISVLDWSALQQSFSPGSNFMVNQTNLALLAFAFLLILLGYGTKAGMFPMHSWLPDGHGEAPSSVSALLSGVLLKSALYVILRFYVILVQTPHIGDFASNALAAFGLLSLVMATPFILNTNYKNRFKRVLAYHSLEHMGIIVFAFGIGTPLAYLGALLHVLNHGFTKALMFLSYGRVQYAYGQAQSIRKPEDEHKWVKGVLKKMPWTGSILGFGGMALIGSPPFSIFFSEFIILLAAIQKWAFDRTFTVASLGGKAAIVLYSASIALIFAGLTIHMGRLLLGKVPEDLEKPEPQSLKKPEMQASTGKKVKEQWWWPATLIILLILITFSTFTTWPYTSALRDSICYLNGGVCHVGR